jgi:hypothetical protein
MCQKISGIIEATIKTKYGLFIDVKNDGDEIGCKNSSGFRRRRLAG